MKNTILKLRKEEINFEGKMLNPVLSIDIIKLREYVKNNIKMFYMKDVYDDVRFEVLAYREYNDSSLWDILFLLNYGEGGFLNIIKNDNCLSDEIDIELDKQIKYYQPYFNYNTIRQTIQKRLETKNNKNRKVIFIKQEYLPIFKEDLKGMFYEY